MDPENQNPIPPETATPDQSSNMPESPQADNTPQPTNTPQTANPTISKPDKPAPLNLSKTPTLPPKPSRTLPLTLSILLILTLIFAGYLYFQNQQLRSELDTAMAPKPYPIESPETIPTPDPYDISSEINKGSETYEITEDIKPGYNKFSSSEASFSFEYPNTFTIYDYTSDEINNGRQIFICDTEFVAKSNIAYVNKCPSGMMIWYNGDGWGGACDPNNQVSITINEESIKYCETDNSFSQLSLQNSDKTNAFLLEGNYSSTFTKEIAQQIIQSLEIE